MNSVKIGEDTSILGLEDSSEDFINRSNCSKFNSFQKETKFKSLNDYSYLKELLPEMIEFLIQGIKGRLNQEQLAYTSIN
jgi:hypothetical protein